MALIRFSSSTTALAVRLVHLEFEHALPREVDAQLLEREGQSLEERFHALVVKGLAVHEIESELTDVGVQQALMELLDGCWKDL